MYNKLAIFLLRIGLASVFLYAAVSSLLDPQSWIGFIPVWFRSIIPSKTFLIIHSISEILLALWLISGVKTFLAAILSSLAIFSIIVFNIGALDIIFRDVAIFFSALALLALTKSQR